MKYTQETKYALVARYYNGESASDICMKEQIPTSTFYSWLKPYKTSCTDSGLCVSGAEFAKMKKKVKRL